MKEDQHCERFETNSTGSSNSSLHSVSGSTTEMKVIVAAKRLTRMKEEHELIRKLQEVNIRKLELELELAIYRRDTELLEIQSEDLGRENFYPEHGRQVLEIKDNYMLTHTAPSIIAQQKSMNPFTHQKSSNPFNPQQNMNPFTRQQKRNPFEEQDSNPFAQHQNIAKPINHNISQTQKIKTSPERYIPPHCRNRTGLHGDRRDDAGTKKLQHFVEPLGIQTTTNSITVMNTALDVTRNCVICYERHATSDCVRLKVLQYSEKLEIFRRKGLCFKCVEKGHIGRNCKSQGQVKCKVDGCGRDHTTLLHREGLIM